jgi:hypothetical protein
VSPVLCDEAAVRFAMLGYGNGPMVTPASAARQGLHEPAAPEILSRSGFQLADRLVDGTIKASGVEVSSVPPAREEGAPEPASTRLGLSGAAKASLH